MAIRRLLLSAAALLWSAGLAWAYPAAVTTDLNMRTGPGTNYTVITVIPGGSRVDISSCSGTWCTVTYAGRQGYASGNHLAQLQTPPPVAIAPQIFLPPPFRGGFFGPGYPPRRDLACDERDARWALGRRANPRLVEQARRAADARTARVIRPGEFYTQEFNRHRLTVEVNRRERIVDLRCA